MLSRVGRFVSARHNGFWTRRSIHEVSTALTLTATAAGLIAWNRQPIQLEAAVSHQVPQQQQQPWSSLVIPTFEATVRAQRLVVTAIMIVWDYESSKLWPKLSLGSGSDERQRWQKEREAHQQELQAAQEAYTDESDSASLDPSEYRKLKLSQRDVVVAAAERLAVVEERIVETGGNELHVRSANRLLKLCRRNGGVYIKIGQHLANLDYLIPPEYIEILSPLFDSAPLTDYSDVCAVVEEDLGASPDKLFASFEEEPIASASLAQVHVAYDKETGKKLAVKVQHRGLRETSAGDVFALQTVVRVLDYLFKDFTWMWIADEIAPQLPKELDFVNEGKNSEQAAIAIEQAGLDCVVPKVVWKHSSERVLCMEFEEGFKATDLAAIDRVGLQKWDIANLISSVFNAQVFLEGFVHCDPHEANILIRERNGKPQMVLLDHGLYKQLDDDFRVCYACLWKSLMMADIKGIKTACKSLGVDELYTLFAAMLTSRPFDEIVERAKTGSMKQNFQPESKSDKAMIQGYAQFFIKDIFGMISTLPRQMILLLKMNDCLRHIDYTLGSPANTLVAAGKYASQAVYQSRLQHAATVMDRFHAWLDYVRVMMRIHIHNLGVRWMKHI